MKKTEEQWKKELTPQQHHVLREQGTEKAFSGTYHDNKDEGMYVCAGCRAELFSSSTKFDSGTGWPSFYDVADQKNIGEKQDLTKRTEVYCSQCGGHLGHVFNDGPKPTGLRYCINSAALNFHKKA